MNLTGLPPGEVVLLSGIFPEEVVILSERSESKDPRICSLIHSATKPGPHP